MNRSRRCLGWLPLASLFLLSVGLAAQTPDTSSNDVLRGTVINSVTHEPVGHALVFSSDNRFATTTDDRGNFEFRLPPLPHVTPPRGEVITGIVATHQPGLLEARRPGFLEDEHAQIYVDPNARDVQIALTPEARIVGKVLLPRSEVAQQVQVQLYKRVVQDGLGRWLPSGSTSTRSNGEFRFAGLPAGAYRIMTQESMDRDPLDQAPGGTLYGYPPVYFAAAPDFDSSTILQLTPGKTADVEIKLEKQPYYRVRVDLNAPTAISFVKVSRGNNGPGFSLGYVEQHNAIEGFLPNGSYTLNVATLTPPSAKTVIRFSVNGAPFREGPLSLTQSRSITVDVKNEIRPKAEPPEGSGTFVFHGVRPRPGNGALPWSLNLALSPVIEDVSAEKLRQPSASDPSILLENVLPGSYWVQVSSEPGYAAEVTSGGVDLLHHPLEVSPGVPSPNIEITVRDMSAHLQGVIEGSPASASSTAEDTASVMSRPYAFVYCIPQADGPGRFAQLQVSPAGRIEGPMLAPGVYRVLAFKREQRELEYRNPEAMRAYESKGIVIRLVEDQTETVRVPLIDPGEPR